MSTSPTPLEELCPTATGKRTLTLGLPANSDPRQLRFALTPGAVGMITAQGIEVRVEAGAGAAIHYPDERYAAAGARIVTHRQALDCDIVMHLSAIQPHDVAGMRRGALLLTLLNAADTTPATIEALLGRRIVTVALDLVCDNNGHTPLADTLSEIDGRAAITLAAGALADATHGKGILLGAIPGIVPCEVTVIGAGLAGRAAAQSALGMGATVRIFDNDTFTLRQAVSHTQGCLIPSALHTAVLEKALRTADVVVVTPTHTPAHKIISADMVRQMKNGVLCYDISQSPSNPFPLMKCVDLAMRYNPEVNHTENQSRKYYINPGAAVPRTTAMAVSNAFTVMIEQLLTFDGLTNAIKLDPGMQRAVITFMGRLTNAAIARRITRKFIDISLLIQFY